MDIRRLFGENLRWLRLSAGLSQEALAARMGADRAFISAMERGDQNVTLATLWQIPEALGVRPMQLLDEQSSAILNPGERPRLVRRKRTKS